jgi:putative SOS response-associated peptidase YedK
MCGRFSITAREEILEKRFGARFYTETIEKRFNIAPTDKAPIITNATPDRIRLFQWGLIPYWAKEPSIGARLINARDDTVADKPAFKDSFRRKRCLVLSDGFYEWRKISTGKIPYRITLKDGEPFAYAGLWEKWKNGQGEKFTFTIITTEPNDLVKKLHNRMPVILKPEDESTWLDQSIPIQHARQLLQPYAGDKMEICPVSTMVNSSRNEAPELIEPCDYPDLFDWF